jgi:digeranylgeranylglycerophospholipid reductase
MRETFDVVVVGAGVAGLSAGWSLATSTGADVLIVERKKEVGDLVRCGEFIPSFTQIRKLMPKAKSIGRFYETFLKNSVCNTIKKIRIFSPRNKEYEFQFDGLVLRRDIFERNIAAEIERAGITLLTKTTAKIVSNKKDTEQVKIALQNQKTSKIVKAKLVVCADGFPIKSGRTNFGAKIKLEDVALCIQQTVESATVDDDAVELYFGKKYAPGGYAWVIPKGNGRANVGVGIRLSFLKQGRYSAIDYMDFFINKHPVSSRYLSSAYLRSLTAKTLWVGGLLPNVHWNRVLLAGDAAGTLIPVNGSGIPTALISGYLAGETASQFLKGNCKLSTYAITLRREIGDIIKRGYLYRRLGDAFIKSDTVFEKVLHIIGKHTLAKVVKCEPISPMFD